MFKEILKTLGGVGIYVVALVLPFLLIIFWSYSNIGAPLDKHSTEEIPFAVRPSISLDELGQELEDKGIIRNSLAISFIKNFRLGEAELSELSITSGEYALSPRMTPKEVFETLRSGKVVTYAVEIPNGATLSEVSEVMAQNNLGDQAGILDAMRNIGLISSLGITATSLEGFIVGGEYQFTRSSSAEDLVKKLVPQTENRIEEGIPNWKTAAQAIGFEPYDILKLASIIEKEAKRGPDRAKLAAVLHNRLRVGLPLQSEVTQQYISGINYSKSQQNPYDTFANPGLPVTPICSPGIDSIKLTLEPNDTDLLFYTKTPDGTLDFSTTLAEHRKKELKYKQAVLGELQQG